jgi:MFS family permease
MTATQRHHAVLRLGASQGLAFAGRGIAMTALIWLIYAQSHSSVLLSVAMLAIFGVSTVVSPIAGHLGDNHDRRIVVIASAGFASAGFLACALLAEQGQLYPLIGAMIITASTQGALSAAVSGAVPNLVSDDGLSAANSQTGAFKSAGFMLGPGIGGALLAVLPASVVFLVAAAFLTIAAILPAGIRRSLRAVQHEHGNGGRLDGYRHLVQDRWLRLLTIAWALVMIGIGPVIVAEVVLAHQFAVGSAGYGLIAVFWDGGGVLGALIGRHISRRYERPAVVGGCAAIALGFTVVGLTPVFWPVLIGMLIAGTFDAFGTVSAQNLLQRRTPDHLRSRVSAALDAVVIGAMSLSFAAGAPLLDLLGAQGIYLLSAVLCLIAALLLVPTLQGFSAMPDAIATTRRVVARRSKQTAIQTGRQVRGIAAKRPAARR